MYYTAKSVFRDIGLKGVTLRQVISHKLHGTQEEGQRTYIKESIHSNGIVVH